MAAASTSQSRPIRVISISPGPPGPPYDPTPRRQHSRLSGKTRVLSIDDDDDDVVQITRVVPDSNPTPRAAKHSLSSQSAHDVVIISSGSENDSDEIRFVKCTPSARSDQRGKSTVSHPSSSQPTLKVESLRKPKAVPSASRLAPTAPPRLHLTPFQRSSPPIAGPSLPPRPRSESSGTANNDSAIGSVEPLDQAAVSRRISPFQSSQTNLPKPEQIVANSVSTEETDLSLGLPGRKLAQESDQTSVSYSPRPELLHDQATLDSPLEPSDLLISSSVTSDQPFPKPNSPVEAVLPLTSPTLPSTSPTAQSAECSLLPWLEPPLDLQAAQPAVEDMLVPLSAPPQSLSNGDMFPETDLAAQKVIILPFLSRVDVDDPWHQGCLARARCGERAPQGNENPALANGKVSRNGAHRAGSQLRKVFQLATNDRQVKTEKENKTGVNGQASTSQVTLDGTPHTPPRERKRSQIPPQRHDESDEGSQVIQSQYSARKAAQRSSQDNDQLNSSGSGADSSPIEVASARKAGADGPKRASSDKPRKKRRGRYFDINPDDLPFDEHGNVIEPLSPPRSVNSPKLEKRFQPTSPSKKQQRKLRQPHQEQKQSQKPVTEGTRRSERTAAKARNALDQSETDYDDVDALSSRQSQARRKGKASVRLAGDGSESDVDTPAIPAVPFVALSTQQPTDGVVHSALDIIAQLRARNAEAMGMLSEQTDEPVVDDDIGPHAVALAAQDQSDSDEELADAGQLISAALSFKPPAKPVLPTVNLKPLAKDSSRFSIENLVKRREQEESRGWHGFEAADREVEDSMRYGSDAEGRDERHDEYADEDSDASLPDITGKVAGKSPKAGRKHQRRGSDGTLKRIADHLGKKADKGALDALMAAQQELDEDHQITLQEESKQERRFWRTEQSLSTKVSRIEVYDSFCQMEMAADSCSSVLSSGCTGSQQSDRRGSVSESSE